MMQNLQLCFNPKQNVMKTLSQKIIAAGIVSVTLLSCAKHKNSNADFSESTVQSESKLIVNDSISSAASTKVSGKEFVKTASVDMEVKDVYDATIKIEKSLQELGGYVITSELVNSTISQETYNQNDENAVMVKKSQMQNNMILKVPTLQLAGFLQNINSSNLYLNSRIINAEDVTANIQMAKLEQQRMKQKKENISKIQQNSTTVEQTDTNERDRNESTVDSYNLKDDIAFSTVNLSLKEPNIRVAEIAVTNSKAIDSKYKTNFLYESKISIINGFYIIQQFIILLLNLWPFAIILGIVFYIIKKKRKRMKISSSETNS